MNPFEVNSLISFAFLRARIIIHSPWVDALPAEQAITIITLNRVSDHQRTYRTYKEIGFFPFARISNIQLRDI